MNNPHLLDDTISNLLKSRAQSLEERLEADVATYIGPIHDGLVRPFRDFIETIAQRAEKRPRLALFLNTNGGSAAATEKMVEILRHHYEELWYFVPDYAMSAGTILVMSGDKIWMDYSSSLGPIDPQVPVQDGSEVRYVPALGILDKVDELIDKSAKGTLTDAEFAMLHKQNLGVIRAYEQARDLSIELLKKWLVQYKFRDWIKHRSDAKLKGKAVSDKQKLARAVEIAEMLSDNKIWHSHGRLIVWQPCATSFGWRSMTTRPTTT